MLYLWLGARRPTAQLYNSRSVSRYYLGVTLASSEGKLCLRESPTRNQRPKRCLYETPYYVAAPVRETGDVIAHLQEPDFFFGSQVMCFSRDPSCYSIGSYVSFPQGSHMQEQYHQWTTLRTWDPSSCLKIWHPWGLTLRRMPYGRGMLRILLWRFL